VGLWQDQRQGGERHGDCFTQVSDAHTHIHLYIIDDEFVPIK